MQHNVTFRNKVHRNTMNRNARHSVLSLPAHWKLLCEKSATSQMTADSTDIDWQLWLAACDCNVIGFAIAVLRKNIKRIYTLGGPQASLQHF